MPKSAPRIGAERTGSTRLGWKYSLLDGPAFSIKFLELVVASQRFGAVGADLRTLGDGRKREPNRDSLMDGRIVNDRPHFDFPIVRCDEALKPFPLG